jgi:hypothetical protein
MDEATHATTLLKATKSKNGLEWAEDCKSLRSNSGP